MRLRAVPTAITICASGNERTFPPVQRIRSDDQTAESARQRVRHRIGIRESFWCSQYHVVLSLSAQVAMPFSPVYVGCTAINGNHFTIPFWIFRGSG